MNKIYFTLRKTTPNNKLLFTKSGIGFADGDNLFIACLSKKQTPMVEFYEGALKNPGPTLNGMTHTHFYQIEECNFEQKNGSIEKGELVYNYYVTYKVLV
jgi:hypothetical protein